MLTPDIIFMAAQVVLVASLLPALRQALSGTTTITLWTSIPTSAMLLVMSFVLFHIDMGVSGIITIFSSAAWYFLAYVRIMRI